MAMIRRLFFVAAIVFSLASQTTSLTAQDDTSPFAQAAKRPGGLHHLLAPADGAKRAPLPSRAEREKALAQVREVFGRPDDPKRRSALVKDLIKAGREDEKPVNRYAGLRHAGELAVEGADLAAAIEAADSLGEFFNIDILAIKASLVERLFGKMAHRELLTAVAVHFDEALAADHFEAAARIGRVGYKAAKALKDRRQIATMRKSAARIKQRKAAFDALEAAIATIKQKPDDAPANLQIGKYLCFLRNDWKRGLPLLVKGGHAIAKREVAAADDPSAQKKVGDAWWDLAETQPADSKTHIKARALMWYRRALPKLAGLSKRSAQKRLDQAASTEPTGTSGASRVAGRTRQQKHPDKRAFYNCVLGRYAYHFDNKKIYPLVNLSVPNKNLWSKSYAKKLEGAPSIAYVGTARFYIPKDGAYEVKAANIGVGIDGVKLDGFRGDYSVKLNLKKGLHTIVLNSGNHGQPFLQNARVQIVDAKTSQNIPLINLWADIERFVRTPVAGRPVVELSGWQPSEENQVQVDLKR
jgi:hypothetical protein